jgi:uncharacterized protein (TIGR03085 family)
MSGWARQEREALVELMRRLGPAAPVVPQGWRTRDLAAHLYVRERRLDAAPGVVLPGALAAYADRVMASALRVVGYDGILDRLAAGPPLLLRPVDEIVNLYEFFVHHEDVRRADGAGPRVLPGELDALLWSRLRRAARLMLRRAKGMRVELVAPGRGVIATGSGPVVRVTGEPGELVLFCFDRRDVAQVDLTGEHDALRDLRAARLGP